MEKFLKHIGIAAPLYKANIDTDQIIPKQFLKRVERSGYGEFLFYDWRFNFDGTPKSEFVLNVPQYKNATILITGPNFGCGSSREHAPWSLLDYGFKAVIAPSFADIFYGNCLKNGLLAIVLPESDVTDLVDQCKTNGCVTVSIDLSKCEVRERSGFARTFEIDEFERDCLLNGCDQIDLTLLNESEIDAFEATIAADAIKHLA